jgi:hypothetical protein
MANILVTSMGLSPGIVTEGISYVQDNLNIKIDKVLVITTQRALNDYANLLVTYAETEMNFKNIDFRYTLPKEDIKDYRDQLEMIEKMRNAIKGANPETNEVIVNIAGGRKTMSADLLLLSYMFNVNYVIHVLSDTAEAVWKEISEKVKGKRYDELEPDLKEKVKKTFQPEDLSAVIYPLFILKDKKYMKAVYLYLKGNAKFVSNLKYKGKSLKEYVDGYQLRENIDAVELLINFLEDTIPERVQPEKKEKFEFKKGWHPPKDIDVNKLKSIIEKIEKLEFVYRINDHIDFKVTSKEVKAQEGGYTDYNDLEVAGSKILLTIPMKDSHAATLEIHTTAYTKDQIEYVKDLLINLKEFKK